MPGIPLALSSSPSFLTRVYPPSPPPLHWYSSASLGKTLLLGAVLVILTFLIYFLLSLKSSHLPFLLSIYIHLNTCWLLLVHLQTLVLRVPVINWLFHNLHIPLGQRYICSCNSMIHEYIYTYTYVCLSFSLSLGIYPQITKWSHPYSTESLNEMATPLYWSEFSEKQN